MKTSDIEVGGVYALAENYEWKGGYRGHDPQRATKVEVLEKGIEQKGRYGYGGSAAKTGVRVRVLESALNVLASEPGTILIKRSAEVRELWETFEPRALAAQAARRQSQEEADAKAHRLIDEITMALPEDFIIPEGALPQKQYSGGWTNRVTLTHDQLVALLDAAAVNALNQTREGTA